MKTVPFYLDTPENKSPNGFPLFFADGVKDLPYAELTDWIEMMNQLVPSASPVLNADYHLDIIVNEDGGMVTLIRENESYMTVDFDSGSVIWNDYCAFIQEANGPYQDLSAIPSVDENGQKNLLAAIATRSKHSGVTGVSLSDYTIPMIAQDGKHLLPVQTLSAFMLYPYFLSMYYNQECLMLSSVSEMKTPVEEMTDDLMALVTPEMTAQIEMMGASGSGFSISRYSGMADRLSQLRRKYPDATAPYFEVGDTAFVRMDEFNISQTADYYAAAAGGILPDPTRDTVSLLVQAHQMITRDNSPIKNVVLDLSLNGGGDAPAAIYTIAWFLGNAQVSTYDTFSGAETTTVYRADVNLDHQYDEKDTLSHLRLFCLTSPVSFSCGNLVPWAFKEDGRVTLLGRVSGGGSCVIQPMTTAWGTSFQISGTKRISFLKNGAYYDVDQGVEPDFIIMSYDNFYDRRALTDYIDRLF
ncbi:MAG: hypothetical protein IKP22_11560 [Clostridia bacterium]|nr:hypothetical protein [Clostridia bacterium]